MSTPNPVPEDTEHRERRVRLSITFDLTPEVVLSARVAVEAITLSELALQIAEDEPNKAISALIGSGLELVAAGMFDHAYLGLQAAVHLLRDVTASQLQGIVT